MSGENPNERRQRLREQMKEFYGTSSPAPKKTEVARKPGVAATMDLDSEYFDVNAYTTDLLRRESLKGLVEKDTELLRRVRRLDNELQELVYKNYAKFISATDTIREMHDNISEMDTKLQDLNSNVSNIDTISQQLTNSLHVHRGKIEETVTVNRMMKKAQFLVGLPDVMRKLIEKKEYNACVKYWVAGDSFLENHNSIPSILKVHQECRGLAKELYSKIEERMCSFPLDDPDAMDNIRKFVEDLRLLRSTSLPVSQEGTFEENVKTALMRSVSENFKSGTTAIHRDIKTSLVIPDFSSLEYTKRDQPLAEVNLREALAQLKSVCALLSDNSKRVYSLLNLPDKGVSIRVAQDVQPFLIDLLPSTSQLFAPLATETFASVCDEAGAYMLLKEKHDTVPHMIHAVVTAFFKQLRLLSTTLKQMGTSYLDTAHSHQSPAYAGMVDKSIAQMISSAAEWLQSKACERPTEEAVAKASGPLRKDSLFVSTPQNKKEKREKFAFCLSRYAYGSLAGLLVDSIQSQLIASEVVSAESMTEATAQLVRVAKELQHRSSILLGQVEAKEVFNDIAFPNPSTAGGVAERVSGLLREWTVVEEALEGLPLPQHTITASSGADGKRGSAPGARNDPFGLGGTSSYQGLGYGASSAGRSSDYGSARSGGKPQINFTRNEMSTLHSNVASIFSNKSQVYSTAPVNGRLASTIASIILYVLKYLVDSVRELDTLKEQQFHSIQINATFLLRVLFATHKNDVAREWTKAWDESVMNSIQQQLNEFCASAYERYESKVPLPNAKLDAIVDDALKAARNANKGGSGGGVAGEEGSQVNPAAGGSSTVDPNGKLGSVGSDLIHVLPLSSNPTAPTTAPQSVTAEIKNESASESPAARRYSVDDELPV